MSADPLRSSLEAALGAQYEVVRLLGRGGSGAVYLAIERLLERPVAIKVLHRDAGDDTSRERFLREARTAARLSHPNIVSLLSFGESGDMLFYVMPYVDGESLETLLRRERHVAPAVARRILADIAAALAYAHQHGVVHRDVKPDNVIIERDTGRPMLTDFGIARRSAEGATLTQAGMIVGTPQYMSPEQASGGQVVDGRADLYALGVIGYRMLTGRLPFEGRTVEELLARRFTTAPPPITSVVRDVPIDLAMTVDRCLERDPAGRWPDAGSLRFALTAGTGDAEEIPDRLETLPRFGTRCIGLSLVSALACTAFFAWDYDPIWLEFLGGCVSVFGAAVGAMVLRARRLGVPARRAVRLALRPPASWMTWWPASLRAPDDVWNSLPAPVRRARSIAGVGLAFAGTLLIGSELGMVIARHHKAISNGFFAAALGFGGVLLATQVLAQVIAWRFAKTTDLDRYERLKLTQERTSGSKFWSRPNIARLLDASSTLPPERTAGPRSPQDLARDANELADRLPASARDAGAEAARVVQQLAERIGAVDVELGELHRHHDPEERARIDERLATLGTAREGESPAIRQMRDLLRSQRALAEDLGRREAELRERRELLREQAQTLWLQLVRLSEGASLDSESITDEIHRLCDSIERRIDAARETRQLLASSGE